MFKRVQFDEWQSIITIIAFFLCFSTFLFFCWKAWRMSKRDQNHMSNLPLQSEDPESSDHEQSRPSSRR